MKRIGLLLPLLLTFLSLQAQYYEVGVTIGGANYMGELSGQRLSSNNFGGMFGAFGRFNATKYLAVKASLMKGTISGSDANARLEADRQRNLSFRSDLLELGVTGELNFSAYNVRDNKTGVPYLFAGLSLVHFNPQAQMRGTWYDLQPMRTEGNKYSRYAVAVPFGLGMKFNLSYKVNVGIELGARKAFTDYLDDVSGDYLDVVDLRRTDPTMAALVYRTPELTGEFGNNPYGSARGDDTNKDWYFFGGITFSVNLTDKYGLDFDPKYAEFKAHLKKEKKEQKLAKRKKKASYQKRFRLKKKEMLQPPVKKQSSPKKDDDKD